MNLQDSLDARIYLIEADKATKAGNFQKALDDYSKVETILRKHNNWIAYYRIQIKKNEIYFFDLGESVRAFEHLNICIKDIEDKKLQKISEYSKLLYRLSQSYVQNRNDYEAIKTLNNAKVYAQKNPENIETLANIHELLASIYGDGIAENIDSADFNFKSAYNLIKSYTANEMESKDLASYYQSYGTFLFAKKNNPHEALEYLLKSKEILENLSKKDRNFLDYLIISEIGIAECYGFMGENKKAVALHYKLLDKIENSKSPIVQMNLQAFYSNFCDFYGELLEESDTPQKKMNILDSTFYFYIKSAEIAESIKDYNKLYGSIYPDMAFNRSKAGKYSQALEYLNKSNEGLKNLYEKESKNANWGYYYHQYGRYYEHQKDYINALKMYQKSLIALIDRFDNESIYVNPSIQNLKSYYDNLVLYNIRQKSYHFKNLYDESKDKKYLEYSLDCVEKVLELNDIETSNTSLTKDKIFKKDPIDIVLGVGIENNYILKNYTKSFHFSEKNKYFILYENIQKNKRPNLTYLTQTEIQAKMQATQTVFEYAYAQNTVLLFAINKEKAMTFDLQIKPDSLENILKNYLETFHSANLDMKQKHIKEGKELYDILLGQAQKNGFLAQGKHLVVIPQGQLALLPFEALFAEIPVPVQNALKNEKAFSRLSYNALPYLLKSYPISYYPSATLAFTENSAPKPTYTVDLFSFAPIFKGSLKPFSKNVPYIQQIYKGEGRSLSKDSISCLPYSEEEVLYLKELFAGKELTLLNEQATEENLKKHIDKARIIHLATHSFANTIDSDKSGVVAFQPKEEGYTEKMEDGILYADEIQLLNLKPELLILSSCQGGLGKYVAGEGILALNRAFMYAGVENIIYSLWTVNDQATKDLMKTFYTAFKQGKNYAEALRTAKIKQLATDKNTPSYWAGFVLSWKQ